MRVHACVFTCMPCSENETFKTTLQELENDPYCVNLPLQSFLSLPMQRVTRYPLLFDAIAQRLDERSLQYDTVKDTVEKLRKVRDFYLILH